jgi:putative transposase
MFQKKGKTRRLRKIRRRESNIVRDINHKVSSDILKLARKNQWGVKLECLKGIRQTAKQRRNPKTDKQKKDKAVLHSWPFHQFGTFVEYKAKLLGIPLVHVDPRYTSKGCARCGLLGTRVKKQFKCPHCGHVEHADANAAFNIALRPVRDSVTQSVGEWVPTEGSSDSPQWATA